MPRRLPLLPMLATALLGIAALLGACTEEPPPDPVCGDGAVDFGELCDDGDANSDTAADACRTDCVPARCGDGVGDTGEVCDDGNDVGGDGCTPRCEVETGILEVEPNDEPASAQPVVEPSLVQGSLPNGDVDCFSVTVPENGAVQARLLPDAEDGTCSAETAMELFDSAGDRVLRALPDIATDCTAIDPETDTFARYLAADTYAICLSPIFDADLPAYGLTIEVYDSCTELPALTPDPSQDLDGDALADNCDPDDDDDGVDDAVDNCPRVPNGPNQPYPLDTATDGFIGTWLLLGPFDTGVSPGACEPSPDNFADVDDAAAAPVLGDDAPDGTPWIAHLVRPGGDFQIRFRRVFTADAPREAYAFAWLWSDAQRGAELSIGADDGYRAWWNGAPVDTVVTCQGVDRDEFQVPVTLEAGWNRLLIKVYDQGGGWGLIVRMRDDQGINLTDLELSLDGATSTLGDQTDSDGDGIGDVCDPDP